MIPLILFEKKIYFIEVFFLETNDAFILKKFKILPWSYVK